MSSRRIFSLSPSLFLCFAALAAVSMLVVTVSVQGATSWLEEARLVADDADVNDRFGYSIAIDGDTAVVGAHTDGAGSAYVFVRSGTTWTQQAKLQADDAAADDRFGVTVSIDGDTIVVGAYEDDDNGAESGSAYVFVRSGTEWTQEAKLLPDDGAAGDYFGISVSVDGDTAVVGSYLDDDIGTDSGSAYVFTRSGSVWTQEAKLLAGDGSAADQFGGAIAIQGDMVVVGANLGDGNVVDSGSAYVFTRSGATWTQEAELQPGDGAEGDRFGRSVSLDGDTIVAGAHGDDDSGDGAGSAYVFVRDGSAWTQEAKLLAGDGAAGDVFGFSAAVDADTAVVGAKYDQDDGWESGSIYIFARSGTAWTQQAKLLANDGDMAYRFGCSVDVQGYMAIAGAYGGNSLRGAAYLFTSSAPPDAADDYAATLVDNPVLIDVAANDTDPDGNLDPASATVISGPAHGAVDNHGDGTMTYTPDAGWSGADSFDYEIYDTEGPSDTATVHLTVEPEGVTRYVAPSGSDDSFCTDSANPCLTIQYALDTGHDGDEIRVAEGTYSDVHIRPRADITVTGVVTQVVYVDKSVAIRGGFTTGDWLDPDPYNHPTIIDAGGQGRGMYVTGEIYPHVEGLRITGGDASGLGGDIAGEDNDCGGGVYVIGASLSFQTNWVYGNTATNGGGFCEGWPSEPDDLGVAVADSRIMANSASGSGGGLWFGGATSNVIWTTISDNVAGDLGGGLSMAMSHVDMAQAVITSNQAGSGGGGIYMQRGGGEILNTVIAENQVQDEGTGRGSGLLIESGSPELTHNTFAGNTGGDGSGLYVVDPLEWGHPDIAMTNNILVDHDVGLSANGTCTVTIDSILWYGTPVTVTTDVTATVFLENQHTGDPAFLDPGAGNYSIGAGSAARDVGIDTGLDQDWNGQPRPMGWGVDLGADEYPDAWLLLDTTATEFLLTGGDPVTYTLVITNTGVENATGAVVTAEMDGWQRATDAWSTQGPCTIVDPGWGGQIECEPGTIVTGAEVVVNVCGEVSPDVPGGQLMNHTIQVLANETGRDTEIHTVTPAELTYPLEQDPWTLDISLISDDYGDLVLSQLMESLYRYGPEGEIEPAGALSHEVSVDSQIYTVTLRADAVWSDGEPVVAQHYVDGAIRMLDPEMWAGRASTLYVLENAQAFNQRSITDPDLVGIHALNDTTLRFTLHEPAAHFPSIMALPWICPVRLDLIGSDPDWTEPGHFVGTGAYLLAAREPGGFLMLEKNPLYYDADGVHFETVLLPILTAEEQLAAYEEGWVDVSLVPADEIDRIVADPVLDTEYHRTQTRGPGYLGLNTQLAGTDQVLVRKALASAVDRESILLDVRNQPRTEAATSVIPPNVPGYQNGQVGYTFDPTQAQIYLAEAGYPGGTGFPGIEIWANQYNEPWIEAVAAGWRDTLGITVTTSFYDWNTYLSMLEGCQEDPGACPYGAYRMGWLMDYADAYNVLNGPFHPDAQYGATGWDSADYRDLLDWSTTELDPDVRTGYLQEADRILVEDNVAFIPIYYYDNTALIKWDVLYEYPSLWQPFLMKWRRAAGPVVLSITPPETTTYLGQQFQVSVMVHAGDQQVDGAAGYLNFDPGVLQVVSIEGGDTLPLPLANEFDNVAGTIDYAAGILPPDYPSGSFELMVVTFEAISASEETTIGFHSEPPRESDATFGGASVLHHTEEGSIFVSDRASLVGSVTLQGRPEPPDSRWSVPLTVRLYPPGSGDPAYEFTPTTDAWGTFTITGIITGDYAVLVKQSHTLQNHEDVALALGLNPVDLGELREGDADDDNCVDLVDFSILATTYALGQGQPGFDPRADFDGNGWVTLVDFSLLVTTFGICGEELPDVAISELGPPRPASVEDDVFISVQPPLSAVEPGEIFTVSVEIQAGSQLLDGAQASLDFDPALLQVVELKGNSDDLPVTLWSTYDNDLGSLDYAAGAFADFPSGTFTLLEITLQATAETTGTTLAFHFEQPRMTDVTFEGHTVLTGYEDGEVKIYAETCIYLPLVLKNY